MKKIIYFSLVPLFISTSCSYKLISKKVNQSTTFKNGELLYYLPKSLLYVKAVYTKSTKTHYVNGISSEDQPTYTVKSIEITPILINDKLKAYTIAGDNGKAFLMAENSGIKLNQYGIVQNMQTTFEDKTLETVENTLKGVASIASVVAILGNGDSDLEKNIRNKIEMANNELAKAIDKNDDKAIKKIKSQLVSYYELLKQYYENNRTTTALSEIIYEFTKEPKLIEDILIRPIDGYTSTIPDIIINIKPVSVSEAEDGDNEKQVELSQADGLIYSIPETCYITANVDQGNGKQTLLDKVISLPQFGRTAILPVTSKLFTNRKTAIEFDPATGTLVNVQRESGSSSENLSKSFANTTDLLKNTVTDLKYNQKIDNLKKEKELMDLKDSLTDKPTSELQNLQGTVDILKLNLEIEKLKKELAELQKNSK